jgi:hypothetical protein
LAGAWTSLFDLLLNERGALFGPKEILSSVYDKLIEKEKKLEEVLKEKEELKRIFRTV